MAHPHRIARHAAVLSCCLLLAAAGPACAQKPDDVAALKAEVAALKAAQDAMRKDLDEIKALLKPAAPKTIMEAPPGMTLPIAGAPSKGAAGAPVVLVEFSDYECPFCARFVRDSYPSIDKEFIQTGKVRHVFRAFPLESIHKNALKAHEAAACAGEQGKYWALHDRLFANPKALGPADLVQHAQAAGLDMTAFKGCLDGGRMTAKVRADIDAGMQIGVQGTPLFLIGTVGADGQLAVKKGISGAQPFAVFKQAFEDVAAGK
jgi:protein-disulfide isomerase